MPVRIELGKFKFFAGATPPTKSIGYSGGTAYGQLEEVEYRRELQGTDGIQIYEKMRRGDGAVRASLLAVKLPIYRAHWIVEPASDRRADKKIAEEIEKDLFKGDVSWQSQLREILTYLDFGFAVFEPLFENRDGKTTFRKLAFRPQRTISKWIVDKDDDLTGVEQQVQLSGGYTKVEIPIENLLILSNEKEGKNWTGVSILRSAYDDWKNKHKFEILNGISADRFSLGIPNITLPEDWTDNDLEFAKTIGKNLRSHEQAYIVKPPGMEVDILRVNDARADLLPDLKYHGQQITSNVLASFLNLGTTESGSRALGKELKDFFVMSVESVADQVAETLTRHLIKRLCAWKYGESVEPPKLSAKKITQVDLLQWSVALKNFADKGLIQVDDELEQFIRDVAGLPEFDIKAREKESAVAKAKADEIERPEEIQPTEESASDDKPEEEKKENSNPSRASGQSCSHQKVFDDSETFHPFRELTELEKKVNWKKIADRQEKDFANAGEIVLDIERTMKEQIMENAAKLNLKKIEKMALEDPVNEERLQTKCEGIEKFGREQVRKEIGLSNSAAKVAGKGLLPVSDGIVALVAYKIANRLKTTAATAVSDTSWERLSDAEKERFLRERLDGLSDSVIALEGRRAIAKAFALGRHDEATILKDEGKISKTCMGSSILDGNVCDECKSFIDGVEFEVGSDEYFECLPPFKNCLGGDSCRCVFIYIGA